MIKTIYIMPCVAHKLCGDSEDFESQAQYPKGAEKGDQVFLLAYYLQQLDDRTFSRIRE